MNIIPKRILSKRWMAVDIQRFTKVIAIPALSQKVKK